MDGGTDISKSPPVSKKRGSMVGKMKEDREEGRKYAKAQ